MNLLTTKVQILIEKHGFDYVYKLYPNFVCVLGSQDLDAKEKLYEILCNPDRYEVIINKKRKQDDRLGILRRICDIDLPSEPIRDIQSMFRVLQERININKFANGFADGALREDESEASKKARLLEVQATLYFMQGINANEFFQLSDIILKINCSLFLPVLQKIRERIEAMILLKQIPITKVILLINNFSIPYVSHFEQDGKHNSRGNEQHLLSHSLLCYIYQLVKNDNNALIYMLEHAQFCVADINSKYMKRGVYSIKEIEESIEHFCRENNNPLQTIEKMGGRYGKHHLPFGRSEHYQILYKIFLYINNHASYNTKLSISEKEVIQQFGKEVYEDRQRKKPLRRSAVSMKTISQLDMLSRYSNYLTAAKIEYISAMCNNQKEFDLLMYYLHFASTHYTQNNQEPRGRIPLYTNVLYFVLLSTEQTMRTLIKQGYTLHSIIDICKDSRDQRGTLNGLRKSFYY